MGNVFKHECLDKTRVSFDSDCLISYNIQLRVVKKIFMQNIEADRYIHRSEVAQVHSLQPEQVRAIMSLDSMPSFTLNKFSELLFDEGHYRRIVNPAAWLLVSNKMAPTTPKVTGLFLAKIADRFTGLADVNLSNEDYPTYQFYDDFSDAISEASILLLDNLGLLPPVNATLEEAASILDFRGNPSDIIASASLLLETAYAMPPEIKALMDADPSGITLLERYRDLNMMASPEIHRPRTKEFVVRGYSYAVEIAKKLKAKLDRE